MSRDSDVKLVLLDKLRYEHKVTVKHWESGDSNRLEKTYKEMATSAGQTLL